MDVRSELQEVFRSAFGDNTIQIHDGTTAKDIPAWDSLSHVNLVLSTEAHFKIRFNTTEIAMLENVGEFVQIIRERTGRQ